MSYKITFESMLDELREHNPGFSDQIVDHYPSGQMEMIIKLRDGSRWRYDYRLKILSRLPSRARINRYMPEEEWRERFAEKLRRRIFVRGLTQDELSEMTGIPRISLSKYMNGHTTPSGYNIERLCLALDCPASELVNVHDM